MSSKRNWGGNPPEQKPELPPTPDCKSSSVEVSDKLTLNGKLHAGLVTHSCGRLEHSDNDCVCGACGYKWTKNFKGERQS